MPEVYKIKLTGDVVMSTIGTFELFQNRQYESLVPNWPDLYFYPF